MGILLEGLFPRKNSDCVPDQATRKSCIDVYIEYQKLWKALD